MKKTIVLLVLAIAGSEAFGQMSQGSIFVTGMGNISSESNKTEVTVGNNTTNDEYPKVFGGSFGLGGGYFLTSRIAAGLMFNLSGKKTTTGSDDYTQENSFGVGLFGRYYVPVSEKFFFFGNLGFGLGSGSMSTTSGSTTTDGPKTSTFNVGIQPGFTFFPAHNFALDMSVGNLGWNSLTTKSSVGGADTKTTTGTFEMRFDLTSINFGIQYYFNN